MRSNSTIKISHQNNLNIRAGWLHLPSLPEVAALPENLNTPSMSKETSALGVKVGIEETLNNPVDINEPSISRLQI